MRRPIAIDLFSGAGGLSLGFEQAGFDVVAAVEVDPIHAAIHKFNFPKCAVFPKSITGLSGNEIRKQAGLGNRTVDVIAGGAPCQGFSLIGQRALDDPRNSLVREFVRIVAELDASYFVFENVKGLTVGKHKKFLEEIIEAFEHLGYRVRMPWRVLNASFYGIPQDRERLFLIGAKRGLPLPEYPEPTTTPAGSTQQLLNLPLGPSCKDAINDLPDAEELRRDYNALKTSWGGYSAFDAWLTNGELNNARMGAVGVYHQHVPAFQALFTKLGGDFEAFYREAERIARLTSDKRIEILGASVRKGD